MEYFKSNGRTNNLEREMLMVYSKPVIDATLAGREILMRFKSQVVNQIAINNVTKNKRDTSNHSSTSDASNHSSISDTSNRLL